MRNVTIDTSAFIMAHTLIKQVKQGQIPALYASVKGQLEGQLHILIS